MLGDRVNWRAWRRAEENFDAGPPDGFNRSGFPKWAQKEGKICGVVFACNNQVADRVSNLFSEYCWNLGREVN